jgi:hypothetical protein
MEIRPDIGTFRAAGLTDEQRFDIGQPDMIRPSIRADFYSAILCKSASRQTQFSSAAIIAGASHARWAKGLMLKGDGK